MAPQIVAQSAAAATPEPVPVYLWGLGNVAAFYTVTVRPRVDGQLLSVSFKEGELVQAGQLLASIDPKPYELQLAQAEGLGIVRGDGHDGHAFVFVILDQLHDSAFVGLRGFTMVGREDDHQNPGVGVILQRVATAIHAGESKIRGVGPDGQGFSQAVVAPG